MTQHDQVPYGPSPILESDECGIGATCIGAGGVRIMLKGFQIMMAPDGEPVAFVDVHAAPAVQGIQAIRQAISDARRTR